jgi:hypothetical protein
VKPKHHQEHSLVGESWSLPKGLENTDGWSEEHVIGHAFGGSDHEDWYRSKGRHGRGHGHWQEGKVIDDFLLGVRSIGDEKPHVGSTGRNPVGWKQGRDSKGSGVWQAVKGQAGDLDGFVHGKFWNDGTGSRGSSRERRHQFNGQEGRFITEATRPGGRYAVKEHSEEDKVIGTGVFPGSEKYGGSSVGNWDELKKTIGGNSRKPSSTGSSEAKVHYGSSYSSVVLHSVKDGRYSA